jgi:hypothetical protein
MNVWVVYRWGNEDPIAVCESELVAQQVAEFEEQHVLGSPNDVEPFTTIKHIEQYTGKS